jgi:hypothetical protein
LIGTSSIHLVIVPFKGRLDALLDKADHGKTMAESEIRSAQAFLHFDKGLSDITEA